MLPRKYRKKLQEILFGSWLETLCVKFLPASPACSNSPKTCMGYVNCLLPCGSCDRLCRQCRLYVKTVFSLASCSCSYQWNASTTLECWILTAYRTTIILLAFNSEISAVKPRWKILAECWQSISSFRIIVLISDSPAVDTH